jgi:hypothetical protein
MASVINVSTGMGTGRITKDADSSGVLKYQTNGVDAMTVGTDQNIVFNGVGGLQVPSGTTAQRPGSPVAGMLRYNTTIPQLEIYVAGTWTSLP